MTIQHLLVTLYVRVWIETICDCNSLACKPVTLYVRVWIETIEHIVYFLR